jgi:uncharacterized protein YbjT (DUF2867 family)
MKFKEVTIFGATGLIGGSLLEILINDAGFDKVNVVTRTPFSIINKKIELHVIDFSSPQSISKIVKNSQVVFAAIGTTQFKVKRDQEAYHKIDYDILINIAKACKANRVKNFSFVSSSGANENSDGFYLKLKGKIEAAVLGLNLPSTSVFRPSLLMGKRKENRFGERLAQLVMPMFSPLMPSKYRPISAALVAKAMVNISKSAPLGFNIYHFKEIMEKSN